MTRREALVGMLAAPSAGGIGRAASAANLTTIRVGVALTDGVTPILYGNQTGMFRDAGLDVQLVLGSNGAAQAAAVIGGSLEVASSSMMPILTGYTRGVTLRIIAGSTVYNPAAPTGLVLVSKTSRITSWADLNGATIAETAIRALDELGIRALVDKNGGSSATLKFVETSYTVMPGALQDGRVDAAEMAEPSLTVAMTSGALRSLGAPAAGIDPNGLLQAAYFCMPAYYSQNKAVVDRFASALNRATAYCNTHHAETVSLLADYTHIDPDVIRKMTRQTMATSVDPRMIQPIIDTAVKYKFIDHGFDARNLVT